MMADTLREILLGLTGVLLLFGCARDIAFRTIPNPLCAGVAVCALVLQAMSGHLPGALIAGLAVFLLAVFLWLRGWLGGGDAKLLAAAALLLSPADIPGFIMAVAVAGGALAACYLLLSVALPGPGGPRPARLSLRILRAERWRIRHRRSLPYACAIATGAFVTLIGH